jgi:hypothetical protein
VHGRGQNQFALHDLESRVHRLGVRPRSHRRALPVDRRCRVPNSVASNATQRTCRRPGRGRRDAPAAIVGVSHTGVRAPRTPPAGTRAGTGSRVPKTEARRTSRSASSLITAWRPRSLHGELLRHAVGDVEGAGVAPWL